MSQESARSLDDYMDERGGFIDSPRLLVCLVQIRSQRVQTVNIIERQTTCLGGPCEMTQNGAVY